MSGLKLVVLSGLPRLPQHRFLLKGEMSAGSEPQPVVPLSRTLPAPGFEENLRKFHLLDRKWLTGTSLHPGRIHLYLKRTDISIATSVVTWAESPGALPKVLGVLPLRALYT